MLSVLKIKILILESIFWSNISAEKDLKKEEGKKIAAKYLKEKKFDLLKEIDTHDKKYKKYLLEGVISTLLSNIVLPTTKEINRENTHVLEGIFLLKKDKENLKNICHQLNMLFDEYYQQRKQLYNQLKRKYEMQMRQLQEVKLLEDQMAQKGIKLKIDVESNRQFQQEYRNYLNELNTQYQSALNEFIAQIKSMKNID